MKIFVFTSDYRSFSYSQIENVDSIEVEVSEDFQGGGKTLNPKTGLWTDDKPAPRNYVDEAEAYRSQLIDQANAYINSNQWPSMQAYGMLSEEETSVFKEWLAWLKTIRSVDTTTAPDVIWPARPG